MTRQKSGFTIIETTLVIAIATLFFMSVVVGIGSRIATGRYEAASTELTDYLRNTFLETLNVENSRSGVEGARKYCTIYSAVKEDSGSPKYTVVGSDDNEELDLRNSPASAVSPGRTDCAIYGKVIFFAKDGKLHVFDLVGNVVTAAKDGKGIYIGGIQDKPILEQLKDVRADYLAFTPENTSDTNLSSISEYCNVAPAAGYTTYEPSWGALFKTANFGSAGGREKDSDFIGMVIITRAPASGDVSTFFYEVPDGESLSWDFDNLLSSPASSCGPISEDEYEKAKIETYYSPTALIEDYQAKQEETVEDKRDQYSGFCVGSDDFYVAISRNRKFIEITPGGQNASAIKLDESGENPCRK